ncbi:MAG: DUF2490 domain-containing protein [Bacteroidia bacterium]|nr:DUF2490 domain-containing protein [Bacteroidia bacterium]
MKWIGFIFLIIATVSVSAQNREEFWSKVNVVKPINPKWSIGMDIQYRTQSDLHQPGVPNLFQYPLTTSYRAWLYYKMPKDWTIVYSPVAFFSTSELSSRAYQFAKTTEVRTFFGGIKSFYFRGGLQNKNRIAYELRIIRKEDSDHFIQHRYRLQNSLMIPLNRRTNANQIGLYVMNEFFLRTQSKNTTLDQNRSYLSFSLRYHQAEIISGYQLIFQRGNNADFFRNIWLTTLNLNIP